MKKVCLLVVVGALIAAPKIGATSVTVSEVSGYSASGFDGGEFNMSPAYENASSYASSVLVNGGDETFCVQTSVHIVIPGTYNASLSQKDSQGTALTLGTAWLYEQFAEGILTGYDYSTSAAGGNFSSRAVAAEYLQEAIWDLQGQSYTASLASYYVGIVTNHFGSLSATLVANNGTIGVGIVNLTTTAGTPVQNLLALPDGGSTVILLGVALSGLGLMFVRKAKKA